MWDVFQNSGSKQICPFPPVMDNLSWGLNECGLTWHQLKLLFEWAVVEYKVWFPQKGSNILDSLVKWNHQELGADLEATPRRWCPGHFCGLGFWYQFKSTPRLIYLVRLPKPEDSQLLSGLSPAPACPEFPSHRTDSVSLGQGRASPVNSPTAASSLWTFCHKPDKPKSNAKCFEQLIISSGGADLLVGNIGCFMLFLFH